MKTGIAAFARSAVGGRWRGDRCTSTTGAEPIGQDAAEVLDALLKISSIGDARVQFEWDPTKDVANVAKHEIGFGDATAVFDDPHVLLEDSTKPEHGEVRWRAIGIVDGRMVTVIFTDRPTGCRIISARKARSDERERYRQGKATS